MVLKIFESVRRANRSEAEKRETPQKGPDAATLAAIAQRRIEDRQSVDAARQRLTEAYQAFLGQLDRVYKTKNAEQRLRVEAHYAVWAALFELLKGNFKDLWSFLGVVEADVEGWYRISPTGSPLGFMQIGREGYSFAAGLEQNSKKGAPFPKKWLTVSVAHSAHYANGIGDERLVGRPEPISDELIGLARCTERAGDLQEEGALSLKNRALAHSIVFVLKSEAQGQHSTEVPISALEKYTLTEMVQPLIVALTHDDLKGISALLPNTKKLLSR